MPRGYVIAAKAELEESTRGRGGRVGHFRPHNDLSRVGTCVSIRDAAQDFLNNGVDADGVSDIRICVETSEEIAALVALVVNDVAEKGGDDA